MKTITVHECSLCGKRFLKEKECLEHEKHHLRIERIEKECFSENDFASFIIVEFENGRYAKYKFDRFA